MWDRTLIESKGFGRGSKRWWTIPIAAGLHIGLIVVAILASYWHLEAVEAPAERITYVHTVPVFIGPPPALGGGTTHHENPARVDETTELTQPIEIPPLPQESSIPMEQFASECETCTDPNAPPGPGTAEGVPGGKGTTPFSTAIGVPSDEEQPKIIRPGMKLPVLIKRVEPQYPRAAIITRSQGIVVLEAVITKTGAVEKIKTVRTDHVLLEKAAIDAVLQWKYQPALLDNRPVKVYFTVTVIFRLK